jgi:hypothetical protein
MRSRLSSIIVAVVFAGALSSCGGGQQPTTVARPTGEVGTGNVQAALPPVASTDAAVRSVEPWVYDHNAGKIIRTTHYRIYTTESKPMIVDRLPGFLEAALAHYRTAFTSPDELPVPPLKLDTFVMGTRPQWQRLTRELMGEQADIYLRIPRGGYAQGGRAVLYDIGGGDTMSIASHEGWHQYTQRTFADGLPIWLEEGIATYMEGHRWGPGGVTFLPWANTERYDQLRTAAGANALMPLEKVLNSSPSGLLGGGVGEDPLVFYAQVWALVHFLHEAEGGAYRGALREIVRDASAGRLYQRVAEVRGGAEGARIARAAAMSRSGSELLLVYCNADVLTLSRQYDAFVAQLVAPGSRTAIVAGRSPIGQ